MDEEELERRSEKTARIVYIVLAIAITATMVISVVSAVNRRKKDNVNVPDVTNAVESETAQETKKETSSLPHTLPPVTVEKGDKTKEPENTESLTPEPETTEKTEPTAVERIYVVPVSGYVVKDYTMDMPVYSVTMNDYRAHNGTDFFASAGDPVYSFTDGTVSKIYYDPMMGQTVEIDHGDGLVSVYQNLQITLPDNIEEGVKVSAGDVIGAVGETSLVECAEVSHLHFSIMKDGAYEPPADYIGSVSLTEE